MATTKTTTSTWAMRPSVRPTTASTTSETTTRATCTSPERARRAHFFTLDASHNSLAQVLSLIICHPRSYAWTHLLESILLFCFHLSFPVFFSFHLLHSELYSELDNPIVMEILCHSANKESKDAYDVSTSLTTQGIPDCLQPFTVNLEDLERCVRTFLWKSELRFGRRRFKSGDTKNGSTVLILTSANNRKRSIPRTDEIGDMKTAEHKSESWNNHQFAAVVQAHCSVDMTRVKTELHRRRRRNLWKFSEPSQKPRVVKMEDLSELGKSCEEYHVIIGQLYLIDWRQEIAERAVRRVKEGTSAVLLQSGLDDKWWSDSVKCCYYLQNVQNLLANGKSLYEQRSGESFKGPIKLFDALIGYLPKLREK